MSTIKTDETIGAAEKQTPASSKMRATLPSPEQSATIQPMSRVEKGQPPLVSDRKYFRCSGWSTRI